MNRNCVIQLSLALILGGIVACQSAEIPKAPVPKSPYLPVVYRYADTMLKNGRDTYGPQKTGLFLSALDRHTLAPLTNLPVLAGLLTQQRAAAKGGPLVGANPQHDQNFLRLLYTLSELSGKPHYREAADAELKWFLENARSPVTDLLPWGKHLSWDVMRDEPADAIGGDASHAFFRPWMLWDRCFTVAPNGSRSFARGLWEHQIANHDTGAFHHRAGYSRHRVSEGMDFLNHAGFYIRTWAAAYAHTKDKQFLQPIEVLVARCEKMRTPAGLIPLRTGETRSRTDFTLSLAIDCEGAAHHLPEPLAGRLRALAAREDEVFCSLPHDLRPRGRFQIVIGEENRFASSGLWEMQNGGITTAQVGMMCVSRYDNTGRAAYRDLILAAADAYLNSLPSEDADAWPVTFGHAISLQLAAWRHSADWKYMERARQFGDIAVEKFWGTNALPKASFKTDHYESITGADTLALALTELHLNILHITAVRCPPNTIDR